MKPPERRVSTPDELLAATLDASVGMIVVCGPIAHLATLRLGPGQALHGEGTDAALTFAPGSDGLQLSTDNDVATLRIATSPACRAIFNDTGVASLGRMWLSGLEIVGQVQILARENVRSGHVEVDGLDILQADARSQPDLPHGYGVYVTQGAFTLWNMHADPHVVISAHLQGLSAGRPLAPVVGSGIFVSGTPGGGPLSVALLETFAVYSDGKIAPGTPDRITGGVFTVSNTFVDLVHNLGPVVTYGANDMVLDNWGTVDRWQADGKITSYGASGIGFVNFGVINTLRVTKPVETFGLGARGFNVYDGTVHSADFDRIVTHADGAVGVQISQPVGRLVVQRGIETYGATGDSLVKGKVVSLAAIALSIKPGGAAADITVHGGVVTHGKGIAPLELLGAVACLRLSGVRAAT